MKFKIFSKILLSYLVVIIIVIFLLTKFSLDSITHHNQQTLTSHLENHARLIKQIIQPYFINDEEEALPKKIAEIAEKINMRITLIKNDGTVLIDTEHDPDTMENHRKRPEIVTAFEGKTGKILRYSNTTKKNMLYVAIPFNINNVNFVIRVSNYQQDISSLIRGLEFTVIKISLVVGLIALLIAYFFSRGITKPIRQLASATRKIAKGNFDVKIQNRNKDEIYDLAISFNSMAEKVKKLITETRYQKEELNRIITSIMEVIWVVNKDSKITVSNDNFRKFVKMENVQNRLFWEVIFNNDIVDFVTNAIQTKQDSSLEISQNGEYFVLKNSLIEITDEMIFSLTDISEIRRIEKMKKDFVSNVSHELRTPLTSIKGYTETLEEELGKDYSIYLNVIKKNTDRLINIVKDILTLSDLEQTQHLTIEEFDLKEVLLNVATILEPLVSKKLLDLNVHMDEVPDFRGDAFKLEQVFINLVENAVKYTENGFVEINLFDFSDHVKVEVKDSGIGIKQSKQNRIFERFYVADKSRSRRVGGTGLGLSIVKHIVTLHKGSIQVESTFGHGTKFTVTLPKGL